jgi:hypothetical protein
VTLERCDQAAVMRMDRLGASKTKSGFTYFTRTTMKLCDCIAAKRDFDDFAELWLHLEKIIDNRLRFALEGALFEKARAPTRSRKPNREICGKGSRCDSRFSHELMASLYIPTRIHLEFICVDPDVRDIG